MVDTFGHCLSVYEWIRLQLPWLHFTFTRTFFSILLVMITGLAFNPVRRKPHYRSGNELWAQVVSKNWVAVLQRIYAHPEEARYRNSLNDTVLHLACIHNPPVAVVAALLNVYPEACLIQNDSGCTPLHLAVRGSSDKIVRRILERRLGAISVRNHRGDSPLALLCWNWPKGALDHDRQNLERILATNEAIAQIWRSACLLVMAAYHNSVADPLPNGKKFRMVHAVCSISDCPLNLIRLAVKLHPEQLKEVDENGHLPLHLAILSASEKQWQWDNAGIIEIILEAYPGAITRRDADSGLYPFMLAAVDDCASLTWVYRVLRSCPELERFLVKDGEK